MARKLWIPRPKRRVPLERRLNETKHFTHYWANSTWATNRSQEGESLEHAASNWFQKRGVAKGDLLYVVTVRKGLLFLCARMKVAKVTSQEDAEDYFGGPVWHAKYHAIGTGGTLMRYERKVPADVARRLRFTTSNGEVGPKLTPKGLFRNQTMRGVRELTQIPLHFWTDT